MTRSNDEINIKVLRRHWPDIDRVLSIAHFVEVYVFSLEKQKWEKAGKAGTLFVCALTSDDPEIERFSLVILNRRGLENFAAEIKSTNDVEITDELMININGGDEDANIYGLWIHAEPDTSTAQTRELNAEKIMELAARAEASRKNALERIPEERVRERTQDEDQEEQEEENGYTTQNVEVEEEHPSAPMGRQLSLSQLFDRQRTQENGFSLHNHQSSRQPLTYHSGHTHYTSGKTPLTQKNTQRDGEQQELEGREEVAPPTAPAQVSTPQFQSHPDTDFFRSGPKFTPPVQEQSGQGAGHGVPVNGGNALLEDMFRRQRARQ